MTLTSLDVPDDIWSSRSPGAYLLLLRLDLPASLTVGRLGRIAFPAGWYIYVGSALGGLGARLRRHAKIDKRHHWHVDYLRARSRLAAVAVRPGPERVECRIAGTIAALPGAHAPAPRFGASDCRCVAHLYHVAAEPDLRLDHHWHVVPVHADAGPATTAAPPEAASRPC
jgi:Uri superfamily endonuclease